MIKAALYGNGRKNLDYALRNALPFRTSGSLKGDKGTPYTTGALQGEDKERYLSDCDRIVYTVVSYATPIAWVLDNGEVYNVGQRFSVTTSRQATIVSAWLGADLNK